MRVSLNIYILGLAVALELDSFVILPNWFKKTWGAEEEFDRACVALVLVDVYD